MGKRTGFIALWLYVVAVLRAHSYRGGLKNGYTNYKEDWGGNHILVEKIRKHYRIPYSAPVPQISSPSFVNVFKPLSTVYPIEKPYRVNEVHRASFRIPAMKFVPYQATVPVPQLDPIPIQIRPSKPVIVSQTKMYNIVNKIPASVPIKFLRPFAIPFAKKISVPITHPVKNPVNDVKEFPIFINKLYPASTEGNIWNGYGGYSASSDLSGHLSTSPNSHGVGIGIHVGEDGQTTDGMHGYQGRNSIANWETDRFQQRSYAELGGKSVSFTTGFTKSSDIELDFRVGKPAFY
ncbi:uncharacterized protein LOC143254607 [Tachypleus tridentatus]|uniref:uncharacterized protein LOC143254607 n=1 Tax=Tachypleus tridentatus TaxID=6853 RepID=UPI003FD023AD